MQITIHI